MNKYKLRRLVNYFLRGRLLRIYSLLGRKVIDAVNGNKIKYFPFTDIGASLFYTGEFEKCELELCDRYIRKNSVVLDVGANIGIHSIRFSEIALDGLVFAFEPSPETFGLLLFNANDKNNILPLNLGLSDSNSISDFYVASDNAYSSLKDTKRKNIKAVKKVVTFTLDGFFSHLYVKKIDFVKIDVEGLEHQVLLGMRTIIKKHKPVIFCEIYGGSSSNECPEKTINLVVRQGYEAFVMAESKLIKYNHHDDRFYNYLFVPKSEQ